MKTKQHDAVQWLEFELLKDFKTVKHGVFMRYGGVSKSPYDSLNVGRLIGDDEGAVVENKRRIQEALGVQELVSVHQQHEAEIVTIGDPLPLMPPIGDALMTSKCCCGLMIKHADCQAAIFYDPTHHAIACVHAGWRGSVKNIYSKTVEAMRHTYGTRPQDLLVCISPSLGPDHAEFLHYKTELPEHFWEFQVRPYYFDFWAISKAQLQQAGVLSHHIECANISTKGDERFFSYRRQKVSGRNATVIALQTPD